MMPSYDRSGTSPKLIGITGQIIDMEHFGNTGTALGELLLRAKRCPSHATDWCEQERMRRDLSGYTCATMDDSPPIYNPLNLPTGTSWKEATTQRGPNLKEAGMFFHLVNNSNEDVHRPTNFGNGAGEGADPNQGAYESDANTFTIDFKQTYVTSKAHLSCSLSPAPSCASNPPMGTAVCASAAPTCQEKSSCCGRWSCSAGAAKCFSPCSPNPCGAHGTCSITLTGGEKCVCKNAYTGAKCQITPGAQARSVAPKPTRRCQPPRQRHTASTSTPTLKPTASKTHSAPQAQHPPHRAAPSAHPTSAPQHALTHCLHAAARRLRGYICEHNCQPRWHIWHVLCRRHA